MSTGSTLHDAESLAVCPQCCHPNPPDHHFCESCNAPLSSMAAILPAWRPWAEGYLVRRAARRVDSWLVLIGMWLLFVPSLIIPILSTNTFPWHIVENDWAYGSRLSAIIGGGMHIAFCGGAVLLSGAILFLTTRSFFRNRLMNSVVESQE